MANLPEVFGAIADGAELLKSGISPGRIALMAYLKRRSDQAREILFDELRRGGVSPEHVAAHDDSIAVIHYYNRAAWEGKARLNLVLLAKAIRGQLQVGNLVADEFFLYADALAALTRDELMLIASVYRFSQIPDEKKTEWHRVQTELFSHGWSKDKIGAVCGRCLRSGLVIAQVAGDGIFCKVSPMMVDLSKCIDFDDALRRAP